MKRERHDGLQILTTIFCDIKLFGKRKYYFPLNLVHRLRDKSLIKNYAFFFPSHFTESIITRKSSVTQVFMVRLKPAYACPPL